jgi:hypothetical protein
MYPTYPRCWDEAPFAITIAGHKLTSHTLVTRNSRDQRLIVANWQFDFTASSYNCLSRFVAKMESYQANHHLNNAAVVAFIQ